MIDVGHTCRLWRRRIKRCATAPPSRQRCPQLSSLLFDPRCPVSAQRMGAQLPARWPGGSKRRVQCQIVPWIDWTALWPVSCSSLLGGWFLEERPCQVERCYTSNVKLSGWGHREYLHQERDRWASCVKLAGALCVVASIVEALAKIFWVAVPYLCPH